MKRLIFILSIISFSLNSCENDNYLVYDVNQMDGIFLDYNETNDSVFYNFGFDTKNEYNYFVKIKLLGMPRNYDRTVKIKINSGKYANDEFIAAKNSYFTLPTEFIFPKDSVEAKIPVILHRDSELENIRAILTFELEDSKDLLVKGHSEFTITFDDKEPIMPAWWATYKWGAFTRFKGQLFFKYFWEMEKENKYLFDKIVARWGRNLDIPPLLYMNNPLVAYPYAFATYVEMKMWEYSEAHPELKLDIQKPEFY